MNYGRLRPSDPGSSEYFDPPSSHHRPGRTLRLVIVLLLSLALLLASAFSATILVLARLRPQPKLSRPPARALSRACGQTRHPNVCLDWLNDYPGAESASEQDLVHISFNVTLQRLSRALYFTSEISGLPMSPRERSAYEDCLELLDGSVDALHRSLFTVVNNKASGSGSTQDVMTWLSAALTNQDTCAEGFADVGAGGEVKQRVAERVKDLSKMLSNCLAIYAAAAGEDFAGVPIQNRRLMGHDDDVVSGEGSFPRWMSREERRLMDTPPAAIKPDVVVSQDGNGTCKTIAEAIKKVPDYFGRRFIIYVRAGRYEEPNLKVGRKKTNVMFVGDGKGNTIISGSKSIFDNMTTFHTASFAASGAGFIARDITFQNWAGPEKHQAVALRVGADHAVVYRCNIIGYQDTLYVHSNRQFFRECDIYGTVDFIFGNAAVVLQNCSLFARKPMPMQKNTITAQNRKDPNQNTGISIHACRILAHTDLMASNGSFLTFLGRPWKLYSRTVYMMSYIGNHIHPRGWLEWNATFALDTLYYGEYMNYGPGGATGQRVQWPGYRVITSPEEASKFTVGQFIFGSSWLPSTGVAFLAGLSV